MSPGTSEVVMTDAAAIRDDEFQSQIAGNDPRQDDGVLDQGICPPWSVLS